MSILINVLWENLEKYEKKKQTKTQLCADSKQSLVGYNNNNNSTLLFSVEHKVVEFLLRSSTPGYTYQSQ